MSDDPALYNRYVMGYKRDANHIKRPAEILMKCDKDTIKVEPCVGYF